MKTATAKRTAPVQQNQKPAFNAQTRCDNCGAQAYVRAFKDTKELFFCIHDGRKMEIGLISQGFVIDDRSWALNS